LYNHRGGQFFWTKVIIEVRIIITYILTSSRRPSSLTSGGYICGTESSGSMSLNSGSITQVDLTNPTCLSDTNVGFSSTFGGITINSGAYLYLSNVSTASKPTLVTGTDSFVWNQGGWVSVDIVTQPATIVSTTIPIIQYAASSATTCITQSATSEVLPVGFSFSTTATLISTYTSGTCVISVFISAANTTTTTTTTSTTTSTSVSGSPYNIVLNKDCTVFTTTVAQGIIGAYYSLSRVSVSTACGSTMLTLLCNGVSTSDANSYCSGIYNNILTPGSALNTQLSPVATSSGGGSSSNGGLYGLLALIAIPVILVLIAVIWFLKPKATPDEQTFGADDEQPKTSPDLSVPTYAEPPMTQPVTYAAMPTPYTTPVTTPLVYRS
jgi:hypothetical protein